MNVRMLLIEFNREKEIERERKIEIEGERGERKIEIEGERKIEIEGERGEIEHQRTKSNYRLKII